MPIEIRHSNAPWRVIYQDQSVCGPDCLLAADVPVAEKFHCRIDNLDTGQLVPDKIKCFRKGGCKIHQATGHFANGMAFSQIARFAGNTGRITTDIKWPAGAVLKDALEIGSCTLPGKWTRFFMVPEKKWINLPESGDLEFDKIPPAIIFQDCRGFLFELGVGDDLWRWSKGIAPEANSSRMLLHRTDEGLEIRRQVTVNGGQEPMLPEPRFYRFDSYISWSCQELCPLSVNADDVPLLQLNGGGISNEQLRRNEQQHPNFKIRLSELVDSNTPNSSCWQSRTMQHGFRKAIRQLAAVFKEGALLIDDGMTPGFCNYGIHCKRKGDVPHWDIATIIDAAIWMRQILGTEWQIAVRQPDEWRDMPSLQCLGCDNGFALAPEE